jgi:hypothetical protein
VASSPSAPTSNWLLVDRERGVVLRVAALFEGEEFWVSEFEELVFDEAFPLETFVFEPPPGEEIRGPDIGMHEPMTIEEAAQRVPFPVFYVPELPEGRWDLHVMYAPPPLRACLSAPGTYGAVAHSVARPPCSDAGSSRTAVAQRPAQLAVLRAQHTGAERLWR